MSPTMQDSLRRTPSGCASRNLVGSGLENILKVAPHRVRGLKRVSVPRYLTPQNRNHTGARVNTVSKREAFKITSRTHTVRELKLVGAKVAPLKKKSHPIRVRELKHR